ncbi:DUF6390 family protein [Nocardioides cynanchi]|uniref:DUF6390 family protein n=1 Tax=Nocardioides cynanchi TaxID=2558918 RepID=UPI0012494A18|nr:DUF6390 family protein [Nocardioides cynanchi]
MSAEGALQFARYAYPPNELGYCGPEGAQAMLVPGAEDDIAARARKFDGAWVYLEVLAEALGSDDPLAAAVVEAYWVGSDLLEKVPSGALVDRLLTRFASQPGGTWRESAGRALAHHSFQVFEVYPWAAMLRAGLPAGPAVSVLDRCRIRTGVVRSVHGESVTVGTSALAWDGAALAPGPVVDEVARWSSGGLSLIGAPAVDDVVALHWDWVCEVLTVDQAERIRRLDEVRRRAVGLVHPR